MQQYWRSADLASRNGSTANGAPLPFAPGLRKSGLDVLAFAFKFAADAIHRERHSRRRFSGGRDPREPLSAGAACDAFDLGPNETLDESRKIVVEPGLQQRTKQIAHDAFEHRRIL